MLNGQRADCWTACSRLRDKTRPDPANAVKYSSSGLALGQHGEPGLVAAVIVSRPGGISGANEATVVLMVSDLRSIWVMLSRGLDRFYRSSDVGHLARSENPGFSEH